jgi:N6-adenosine-specific RNA methylase IME4
MLARATRTDEVKRIRDVAKAMQAYARTQKAGKEIALDAGEIILRADSRLGELARVLPKASAGRPDKMGPRSGPISKSTALADVGISKQRAAEFEKVAALPRKDLDAYVAAERKAGRAPSTGGAVALSRLSEPERKKALAKLEDKPDVRQAINEVKLEAKRELAAQIRANPVITPDGRYQVIVADPPWKYDTRADDTTHRGKNLYPDMTLEEIRALPVTSLAQENCILWLWTTNAFMRGAFEVLDAWGFEEKTILTWDKEILGLGDWLRNVTEHCILAVRGRPLVDLRNHTTLIREKRREHSRKPEAFYQLVESLCPGSKVELFARTRRDGWAAWGAEPGKFDAAS